jgi:hypothetical protein
MGIAACIICAVAVEKMGACGHAIVSRLVGKVAIVPFRTTAVAEEGLTHGNLGRFVVKAAVSTERTGPCINVRGGQECLPTDGMS